MVQKVKMPDGVIVGFSDDTPRDEIKALIAEKFPEFAQQMGQAQGRAVVDQIQQHGIPGQGQLAFADQFIENVPIIGKPVKEGLSHLRGAIGSALGIGRKEDFDAFTALAVKGAPVESTLGNIAGNVLPMIPLGATALGGRLLGASGNLLARSAAGAASGAALAGADTLVDTGGDLEAAGESALTGAVVGGAAPAVAKIGGSIWGGVKRALSGAASAGVDDTVSAELKSAAHDMFEASDAAGVGIKDTSFVRFLDELEPELQRLRIGEKRDPLAMDALEELRTAAAQMQTGLEGVGGTIELGDLHVLRQIIAKAAQSREGRDTMLGTVMLDKLDDYIGRLGVDDIAGAADPTEAARLLHDGIATWSVAKKLETLEQAMYNARLSGSGVENGLRVEFRKILKNNRLRQGFSDDEIAQMEQVVEGTVGANAMKLLGRFGFGGGVQGNSLGGILGVVGGNAVGGIPGAMAAGVGGGILRRMSERSTLDTASGVLRNVANRGNRIVGKSPIVKRANRTVTLRQLMDGGPQMPIAPATLAPVAANGTS